MKIDLWTYADLSALCGTPQFDTTANPQSLLNPQVIFEVLSPSTENFDRGDKFEGYKRIESLTDYVLIASEMMRVNTTSGKQPANGCTGSTTSPWTS